MRRTLFGAVAIGSLALAACGGDGDDTKTVTTPPPVPAGIGLDGTFGTAGISNVAMTTAGKDRVTAIAVGEDGKVYAAGFTTNGEDQQFALIRLGADGKLDPTFGSAGVATVNVSPGKAAEQARSVAVQADGKIVLAGTAEHDTAAAGDLAKDTDIVAVRFDSTGKPDATFGTGGIARVDLSPGVAVDAETYVTDSGYGVTTLPNGGVAIMGSTPGPAKGDADFAIVGLTKDGKLDAAFGTAGVTKVNVGPAGDSPRNITVHNSTILATGYAHGADEVVSPVLIRTSLDGKPDATFGTNGVATHNVLAAVAESYSVRAQGEDYVLVGYGKNGKDDKVNLVAYRFTGKGEWDKTFGTDGVTQIDNAGEDDRGRNLAVLPDGRILYVGSGKLNADKIQPMVVLLSKDGKPEAGFGTGGKLLSDFGGPSDSWFGVALTADGKTAYLAGYRGVAADSKENDDAVVGRIKL